MNLKEKPKKETPEEYYAFFDAEYTCYMKQDALFDRKHSGEVISVGLVICDKKFRIRKTFYSVIRPKYNPVLTAYCKSLTGLKQREIDRAPSYEDAFQKMSKILTKYPVKEIFVWGSDHRTLEDDIVKNHTSVAKNHKKIVHKTEDITKRLTCRIFGKGMTVSLADMKYVCNQKREVSHNALGDAKDLYYVTKTVVQNKYNKERAKALYDFVENREIYHRYRRFKSSSLKELTKQYKKDAAKTEAFRKSTDRYVAQLIDYYGARENLTPEIAALCDDIRMIAEMEPQYNPRLM